MNAIAIDDEPLALEIIRDFCGRMPGIELIAFFDDAVTGRQFVEDHPPDLLFLDIHMPDINGLDLVNSLSAPPMLIFTTAHKEFALEGFELEAVDYLLKPFSFGRFEKAIHKAAKFYQPHKQPQPDSLFVYAEYRMMKILFTDIIYIESLDDYIKIHLKNGRFILTLLSLKKVAEKLPAGFMRIHRSYIVSSKQIDSFLGRKLRLISGAELPVSETYLPALQQWMKPS
ncbi:LytR/AlgR family response regulator transcription factor [Niabella beijingensis]|uniref:LytR/AlgR family response regulator transcription factor n=1 Tax=Niabella beijingensis TaxID=2872700 RepID=UPI001CBADC55|nr:LytTR family DNA-binding domain-containing protein [Niabella beijingensis]MBZ4191427.1 LytTR family DNA-binding domain-containing protein [Niabella beijingensis]